MSLSEIRVRTQSCRFAVLVFAMACMLGGCLEVAERSVCATEQEDRSLALAAHAFGKQIQKLVKKRDLAGLFALVDGELQNGPRRAFAEAHSFDDIFGRNWRAAVMASDVPCGPLGWRGYMLGSGHVWYEQGVDGTFEIFAINGAADEPPRLEDRGWRVDGQLLHPQCFARCWDSADNFQAFTEAFNLPTEELCFRNPGDFLGKEITFFEPIVPWWSDGDEISLVNALDRCAPPGFEAELKDPRTFGNTENDRSVYAKDDSGDFFSIGREYTMLGAVPVSACQRLAPHFAVPCRESYLVKVVEHINGSKGLEFTVGVFGLFNLPDLGPSIVPLRYFDNQNEALNALDRGFEP